MMHDLITIEQLWEQYGNQRIVVFRLEKSACQNYEYHDPPLKY